MFPEDQNPDQATPAEEPTQKKRNCGRTGPTTDAGKFNSSQNARKHGACARTMILPVESEQGWLILLSRYMDRYQPNEESLEYDFVLRTAQAEWFRLRTVRQYDEFLIGTAGEPPFLWTPEQVKMHDLMLRYRGAAERAFHRENRALEAHYKIHKLAAETETKKEPPLDPYFSLGSREEIRALMDREFTPMDQPPPPCTESHEKPLAEP